MMAGVKHPSGKTTTGIVLKWHRDQPHLNPHQVREPSRTIPTHFTSPITELLSGKPPRRVPAVNGKVIVDPVTATVIAELLEVVTNGRAITTAVRGTVLQARSRTHGMVPLTTSKVAVAAAVIDGEEAAAVLAHLVIEADPTVADIRAATAADISREATAAVTITT